MPIKYENCPFCHGKNVQEKETKGIIVVFCQDCNNKIEVYAKE